MTCTKINTKSLAFRRLPKEEKLKAVKGKAFNRPADKQGYAARSFNPKSPTAK